MELITHKEFELSDEQKKLPDATDSENKKYKGDIELTEDGKRGKTEFETKSKEGREEK